MSWETEKAFDLEKIRKEILIETIDRALGHFEDNPEIFWTQIPMEKPLWEDLKVCVEKTIPKKPIENFYDETDGRDWYDEGITYTCPSCEKDFEVGRYSKESEEWIFNMRYCHECGQLIDWD